jgi:S-adenosylmethionine synthetase
MGCLVREGAIKCRPGRWVAKSIVVAGLAVRGLIQVSYEIRNAEPLSVYVYTCGSGNSLTQRSSTSKELRFETGPVIRALNLMRLIDTKTASYRHFSKANIDFPSKIPEQFADLPRRRRK